jgi:hypothetical protein
MRRVFVAITASLVLAISCERLLLAQKPQPQAEGTGGKDTGGKEAKAEEPNPLLTDPDAVEAAVYRCSEFDSQCPLKSPTAKLIAEHFQQPLLSGTSADTDLAKAVRDVLNGQRNGAPIWSPTSKYAVLHLVDLNQTGGAVHDRWILASRDKDKVKLSTSRRTFGTHQLSVIFVYVNAEVAKATTAPLQEERVKTAYNDVSYRAVVKGKRSAAFEHLLAVLRLGGVAQADDTIRAAFIGYGDLTNIRTPSDISIAGVRTSAMKVVGQTLKLDNEGKSVWDASIAVPVNKLSLVEYEEENGTFFPKEINKQSIYGVINVYPVPVDLKEGKARWIVPRVIAGLGLTGRPGENILAGLAFGIPEFQLFVGRTFTNHRVPKEGQDPSNGANLKQEYDQAWSFGINVPVVSALKKATAKTDKEKKGGS